MSTGRGPVRVWWAIALGLAWLVAGVAGCKGDVGPQVVEAPKAAAPPVLRLALMTDLSGYLEPCGCTKRPLGGIDKAAAKLRELSSDGVPTLWLQAGDLFFAPASAHAKDAHPGAQGDESAQQDRWQAETLADVLARLGMAAAAPGRADLRYGAEQLAALQKRAGFALLAAGEGAQVPGVPLESARVFERAGHRVGVWGLAALGDGPEVDRVAQAAQLTRELRAQGAELVIGLASLDTRVARRIAGGVSALDFLVVGGADSPEVLPPERVGSTTLLRAAHRGHGLLVVELYGLGGDKPLEDVSAWTHDARKQALAARIAELEQRIAEWKRAAGTDPGLLREQEARLASLRAEHAATARRSSPRGHAFAARFVELDPDVKPDAEARAMLEAHDARVNDHNRVALAHLKAPPVPEGAAGYAGSAECKSCHVTEFAWWRQHAHGRAYETLVKRNKQFNLSCVGCHVTGYNQPGGATVVHNDGLIDVGCESCHGPGSMHVDDQDVDEAQNVALEVPESVCVQCHNPDHSDQFDYAVYRSNLIVPGHGLPMARAQQPPQAEGAAAESAQ